MKNYSFRFFCILLILAFLSINSGFATDYYVDSQVGSDSNNGKSPATAWKSIDKVNAASITGGDSILFMRGQVFRGTIVPKGGSSVNTLVTYGAYGDNALAKPKLLASYQRNSSSDWKDEGSNLWSTGDKLTVSPAETLGADVGNIILGNETSCGIKVWNKTDLNVEAEYWYDTTADRVYFYTTHGNPATYYQTIELATKRKNVDGTARSYLIFENLDFRYGGDGGIGFQGYGTGASYSYPKEITIRDVDVSYVGGAWLTGTTRAGNGIGFWCGGRNIIVERCRISQCYDCGLSPQGDLDGHFNENFYFRNNIFDKNEQSFEMWQGGISSTTNLYFENNTCMNAGFGWSRSQRPNPLGVHILFYGLASTVTFTNLQIRNNVFINAKDYGIFTTYESNMSKVNFDYNCWYPQSTTLILQYNYPLNSTVRTPGSYVWSSYRAAYGNEAHSIMANPRINTDGSLMSNSPCIDKGLALSTVSNDFKKTARPQGLGYDMGAFEYYVPNEVTSIKSTNFFKAYPNPASDNITISLENSFNGNLQISLISLTGKIIENQTIKSSETGKFNYHFYNKPQTGYYILKVSGEKFSQALPITIK
ncbi:MAG: T9SS type A sorting domain-containing protein [Paludibacter sp.]